MKDNFKEITMLVQKLKTQDESVFAKLYELTYQRIYFLCYSILKNEEDAKDAVQETYIKILGNISFLQNNKLFIAWANKVAYNICMRMLSKKKEDLVENSFLNAIADDNEDYSPYCSTEKAEKAKTLAALIDELEPVLRSTLIFKYFDDRKIKQIADIMDCPEGTVKSRLNTAKRLLKTAIQKKGKNDILFSAVALFPIREALALSATQSTMAPQVANLAFQGILPQSSMSANLSFAPQPAATPKLPSHAPTVVGISAAAVGGGVLALSAAMALSPPVISNIEVHQPDMGYTNQDVSITAMIDSPLKPIKEVYLLSESGRKIAGTIDKKGEASFSVSQNGKYSFYAVTTRGLETMAKFEVTAIDNELPTIIGYTYSQTELSFMLDDDLSGIDFASIMGETATGEKILPINISEAEKKVTFAFPKENIRLIIKDMAGNISYHKVARVQK